MVFDNHEVCQQNSKYGLAVVWDTAAMTCRYFDDVKEIEKEYLEKAIAEARKNTNIFTEETYVEIHQQKFDYVHKVSSKKGPQQCLFVVLKKDKDVFKNIAKYYFVQKSYPDFFSVLGIIGETSEINELMEHSAYIQELNVVRFNQDSDVTQENWRHIISDITGFQVLMYTGYDELRATLQ